MAFRCVIPSRCGCMMFCLNLSLLFVLTIGFRDRVAPASCEFIHVRLLVSFYLSSCSQEIFTQTRDLNANIHVLFATWQWKTHNLLCVVIIATGGSILPVAVCLKALISTFRIPVWRGSVPLADFPHSVRPSLMGIQSQLLTHSKYYLMKKVLLHQVLYQVLVLQ